MQRTLIDEHEKNEKSKSSFLDILQLKYIISAHSESQKSSLLEHRIVLIITNVGCKVDSFSAKWISGIVCKSGYC